MKKVLVSSLLAAGVMAALATPITSFAQVEVQLDFGPPAVRYEAVPAPRSGYVWSNGYYRAQDNNYVWVAGDWQTARPGYVYNSPTWVENDGRWTQRASRWDRDGNGVAVRRDSDDRR